MDRVQTPEYRGIQTYVHLVVCQWIVEWKSILQGPNNVDLTTSVGNEAISTKAS